MDVRGYSPPALYRPGEIMLHPWSYQSLGTELVGTTLVPSSQNFVTANLAVYVPIGIPEPVTITKLWWGNGAAVAGNLDVGIYDTAGTRLVSTGSVAQAGTTTLQVTDVTDLTLARGVYYIGFASDTSGATQKVQAVLPTLGIPQAFGLLQEASAFPLPATATFAIYASAFIPLCGAQGYRAVGP